MKNLFLILIGLFFLPNSFSQTKENSHLSGLKSDEDTLYILLNEKRSQKCLMDRLLVVGFDSLTILNKYQPEITTIKDVGTRVFFKFCNYNKDKSIIYSEKKDMIGIVDIKSFKTIDSTDLNLKDAVKKHNHFYILREIELGKAVLYKAHFKHIICSFPN
ncbi:hypothetical protein [Ornithobacterium rhinotracheale]|uniref:hypothetical protein n=1 Tax=Ornithobacterium rhinotracheale TaxID=28251 RepID=UPI004036F9C2